MKFCFHTRRVLPRTLRNKAPHTRLLCSGINEWVVCYHKMLKHYSEIKELYHNLLEFFSLAVRQAFCEEQRTAHHWHGQVYCNVFIMGVSDHFLSCHTFTVALSKVKWYVQKHHQDQKSAPSSRVGVSGRVSFSTDGATELPPLLQQPHSLTHEELPDTVGLCGIIASTMVLSSS